ncbi:MAG: 4Fe-4S dicluster domain-containing protein [Sandaracinus sp.]|nr:4Fe-4S dicluster domain-containing protein [Sandaracinus sp.]
MSRRKPYELTEGKGRPMWRSLEDKLAAPEEKRARAESESEGGFLSGLLGSGALLKKTSSRREDPLASQPTISRRGFLATGGTAAAALSLAGCVRRPTENILPFVEQPEYLQPGIPLHFATVTQRGNDAIGLLVTSHDGRPTKVEGNPEHPSSLGATDLLAQQAIWDLYDPDRSRGPAMREGESFTDKTFAQLDEALREFAATHQGNGGAGLRVLMPPTNSPSMLRIRTAFLQKYPSAKVHTWSSVNDDAAREGARLAFGRPAHPVYDLTQADVVLALDSDFLSTTESGSVRAGRGYGARRSITLPDRQHMLRLYSVEGAFTITGASADHRLRVPAQDVERFLKCLAKELGSRGVDLGAIGGAVSGASADEGWGTFLTALADDLAGVEGKTNRAQPGRSFVVPGPRQPARVHALAAAINAGLGALGRGVRYFEPSDPDQGSTVESIRQLAAEMGDVQTLVILGCNPVYDAPADLGFAELLGRDGLTTIHLSTHRDETSLRSTWHVPMAHELETWGDQRSVEGVLSIQQPLIAPLFGGRSGLEMLAMLAGERNWRGHYVVRRTFRDRVGAVSLEREWRRALHAGLIPGSGAETLVLAPQPDAIAAALGEAPERTALSAQNLEVQFLPDPTLFDGRFANNLWALETPDPMSKLTWDNAALVSKKTRDELGLSNGDVVRLTVGERNVSVPVFALPGHAEYSVTLLLGWGRSAAGRYGTKQTWPGVGPEPDWQAGGFDAHPIRTSDAMGFATGARLEGTGESYLLVTTQEHGYMEGRPIAIDATLQEYREEPEFASYRTVEMDSIGPLWEQIDYSPREVATGRMLNKWGMVIDLSACTGCNACTIACQAENNIPCVGKQEVKRGRDMAWLRIDRYFVGDDLDEPEIAMQPIGCQHCEEAPCENVCPVNATAHSPEGLNDMAYNRCIGTRYCANNCPYKVRRFNYLDWHNHLDDPWGFHGEFPEMRKMQFNPNVTVRMRGVMEKCSYCVQRIQEAKFAVRREGRQLQDGDVITACQSACPSGAIVFGDLNDADSRVARADATNRRYKLLAEVGAQPRTTFLAKIRNTNPHLGGSARDEEAHG